MRTVTEEPQHYFTPAPAVRSARRTVRLALRDVRLTLASDAGVFSADGLDPGTLVLLEDAPAPPPGGTLLDLGCGYGPVALTLATRDPAATVWAVDVNARARALTAENAATAGLSGVRVAAPDEVPAEVRFAAIRSNPPIKAGKGVLHAMLTRWLPRLLPGGEAVLVVNRNLGADSLQRWLTDAGYPTRRIASRRGYRLLAVSAPGADAGARTDAAAGADPGARTDAAAGTDPGATAGPGAGA